MEALLPLADRIAHLPVEMVTGRYDCCCTPENAYDLAARLPRARLVIVPGGGHTGTEVAMAQAVIHAPVRLYHRILAGEGG
jgi:proline iminopeptidase